MTDIQRLEPTEKMSRIVVHNGTVFLAGITAADRDQDIAGQTAQILARVEALLATAGTDKSRLLTTQIWLKDIASDFASMNKVWLDWLTPGAAPTRATVQAEMASPSILIEVVVTAALP